MVNKMKMERPENEMLNQIHVQMGDISGEFAKYGRNPKELQKAMEKSSTLSSVSKARYSGNPVHSLGQLETMQKTLLNLQGAVSANDERWRSNMLASVSDLIDDGKKLIMDSKPAKLPSQEDIFKLVSRIDELERAAHSTISISHRAVPSTANKKLKDSAISEIDTTLGKLVVFRAEVKSTQANSVKDNVLNTLIERADEAISGLKERKADILKNTAK